MRRDMPLSSPTSTNIGFGGLKSDTESETRLTSTRSQLAHSVDPTLLSISRLRIYPRSRAHVQRTLLTLLTDARSSLACLPRLLARTRRRLSPRSRGRELTFTNAHARREDNCCGVTQHDEVAHNPPPASRRRSAMSMCNNPYRHGWLPLLGLHNRALIDNLYGACRLFDYPPPAGR